MSLVYIGTSLRNDHYNPLAGKLSFCNADDLLRAKISHDEFASLLDQIKDHKNVKEVSLVSTCNRFEIYAFLHEVNQSSIEYIKRIINSVNNANLDYASLSFNDAKHQFLRTYCGLNSGLIGESEISMQIDISFRQSLSMGYLGIHGGSLLEEAISLRKIFDNFIYKNKISYCSVALNEVLGNSDYQRILVLGSGSTARQACVALKEMGFKPESITVAHRISSSSGQVAMIKKQDDLENMRFIRTKYGYHSNKSRELIYNSDLVIFAIDSKLPVINIPANSKLTIVDFNSKPSCTFTVGANINNYYSAMQLDQAVRNYSRERLQDLNFINSLKYAEDILTEQLENTTLKQSIHSI